MDSTDGANDACPELIDGAPGEIRTPDRLVRSQVLYPTELRAHIGNYRDAIIHKSNCIVK
jgi:hypothetical protein